MIEISKRLSKILRHDPGSINLKLDENGWANVEELIQKLSINMEILEEVVTNNNKQRFAFNETKTKIRANQGHSINIDLGLKPSKPPAVLFHGTALKFLTSIKEKGLVKGNRQHVHLSTNENTAKQVGSRHGSPVVLKVRASDMYFEKYKFYLSDNGVWLTNHVPINYLIIP